MRKIVSMMILLLLVFASLVNADDFTLQWDAVANATGYKVYRSTDNGATWTEIGDVTTTTSAITGIPSSGMQLFRVSAYNANGESIRFYSGAWYNGDWKPVDDPGGAGID